MAIEIKPTKRGGHYCGRTIALPHLGTTTIPENGIVTIEDDEKAHAFVAALPRDWQYVNEKDRLGYVEGELEKPEETEASKTKPDDSDTQTGNSQSIFDDLDEEEKKEYIEALPGMTRKNLEGLCAAFPGGEWRGKNKEELVNYLKGKLGA